MSSENIDNFLDDSFEVLEQLCEEATSDPESTLLEYFNSAKKKEIKKRTRTSDIIELPKEKDKEEKGDVIQNVLNRFNIRGEEKEYLSRVLDNTQIETLPFKIDSYSEPLKHTSPVKLAELLGSLTVLDDNEEDFTVDSNDSSPASSKDGASIADNKDETPTKVSDNEEDAVIEEIIAKGAIGKRSKPGFAIDEIVEKAFNQTLNVADHAENDDVNKSLHFNDTLEEIKYILRQGVRDINAESTRYNSPINELSPLEAQSPKSPEQTLPGKQSPMILKDTEMPKEKVKVVSLQEKISQGAIPKIRKNKAHKYNKNIASSTGDQQLAKSLFAFDMKPRPIQFFYNEPSAILPNRHEEFKQEFSHIISPIQTYVQKTAKAPLMTTVKEMNRQKNLLAPSYESCDNNELYGSLEKHEQCSDNSYKTVAAGETFKFPGVPLLTSTLPKKAYISSEIKHIVDERSSVTIPGGKEIPEYLESAIVPTVLRHDGKLKIPGTTTTDPSFDSENNPHRNRESLADLSLVSGDVSMYTMKDAHKL